MQRGAADHTRVTSVLGIGELLWDLLPAGPRLGGAPFNATVHLSRLGFDASFLTAVGDDDLGRRALDEVRSLGVATALIGVTPDVPTGTVGVEIDKHGHPTYVIHEPAAYGLVEPDTVERTVRSAKGPDAIVFGTLAQRFAEVREATRSVLAAWPSAMRAYDVNLREGWWTPTLVDELLHDVTVLRLNDTEVGVLAAALDLPGSPDEFARGVAERYGIHFVCVTAGPAGATAWSTEGRTSVAGHEVSIADTVGAGDAFTAGLVGSLLDGADVADALRVGNALGALVASRPGATPLWTVKELDALLSLPDSGQATRR